jgi:hypothetical protein
MVFGEDGNDVVDFPEAAGSNKFDKIELGSTQRVGLSVLEFFV